VETGRGGARRRARELSTRAGDGDPWCALSIECRGRELSQAVAEIDISALPELRTLLSIDPEELLMWL
jgi:hypothetical protein